MWALAPWTRKVVVGAALLGTSVAGPALGFRALTGAPSPRSHPTTAAGARLDGTTSRLVAAVARPARPGPGPVTFTTLPADLAAGPSGAPTPAGGTVGAPQPAGQVAQLAVRPGLLGVGPTVERLRFRPESPRASRRLVATLAPVRIVDARGTLAGWEATVALDRPGHRAEGRRSPRSRPVLFCVRAGTPSMVSGNAADRVVAARPSCAPAGRPVPLVWAAPGGGGGTYEAGAVLTVLAPPGTRAFALVATVAISVH